MSMSEEGDASSNNVSMATTAGRKRSDAYNEDVDYMSAMCNMLLIKKNSR